MFLRYVVEAPIELLVETLQKSCEDFARQRVTFAEDARRFVVETSMYCDGLNQVAAVILAAKKVIFVGGLRELELEADCTVNWSDFETRCAIFLAWRVPQLDRKQNCLQSNFQRAPNTCKGERWLLGSLRCDRTHEVKVALQFH